MKNLNVAITGLHAADSPAPGVPVARSILHEGKWEGKIIGLGYDSFDTGIYDKGLFDEIYLIPYPSEGEFNVLARIRQIHQKTKIDVLIPTLDAELNSFMRIRPELEEMGIKVLLPNDSSLKMRSKAVLSNFCEKYDIPFPRTKVIFDYAGISQAIEDFGFPIVVKGSFYDAYIAYSYNEAVIYFNKISSVWGLPIVVQEMIKGEEYDVCCLSDFHGKVIGKVPMRKLRLTPKGKAWAGVTILDKELLELSDKILERIHWNGPCELEFLKNEKNGKYYLIEINPRFPAWIYLSAGAGTNLPYTAVRIISGEHVEPLAPCKSGVIFVRHATDMICPLDYLESLTTKGELIFNKSEEKEL
ncbi:ATP-grasp domain-containing protein [bacterium]|nr:ATP-grasp domain-containing protein [bacterium]